MRPIFNVEGLVDRNYLQQALRRGGLNATFSRITIENIGGSKSILLLQGDTGGRYVLKRMRKDTSSWWAELVGPTNPEAVLWNEDITTSLPGPLTSPNIDISFNTQMGEWWLLMHDLSAQPAGNANSATLPIALAALHGRHWNSPAIQSLPLASSMGLLRAYAQPFVALLDSTYSTNWARKLQEKPDYLSGKNCMALFDKAQSDFYLHAWAQCEEWHSALVSQSRTLCHGDFHSGNMQAVAPDKLALYDWQFAQFAPGVMDLFFYEMLTFWSGQHLSKYSDDNSGSDPVSAFRLSYLSALRKVLGKQYDPDEISQMMKTGWLLNFLKWAPRLSRGVLKDNSAEGVKTALAIHRRAFTYAMELAEAV